MLRGDGSREGAQAPQTCSLLTGQQHTLFTSYGCPPQSENSGKHSSRKHNDSLSMRRNKCSRLMSSFLHTCWAQGGVLHYCSPAVRNIWTKLHFFFLCCTAMLFSQQPQRQGGRGWIITRSTFLLSCCFINTLWQRAYRVTLESEELPELPPANLSLVQ